MSTAHCVIAILPVLPFTGKAQLSRISAFSHRECSSSTWAGAGTQAPLAAPPLGLRPPGDGFFCMSWCRSRALGGFRTRRRGTLGCPTQSTRAASPTWPWCPSEKRFREGSIFKSWMAAERCRTRNETRVLLTTGARFWARPGVVGRLLSCCGRAGGWKRRGGFATKRSRWPTLPYN